MKRSAWIAVAFLLGACNTGFLQDEPPQKPVPEKTPRILPGASKAEVRLALEKIAAAQYQNLEEIGAELRVVRASSQHIWACNAWIGMKGTTRFFLVATVETKLENSLKAESLGYKPLPAGTSPPTGECESKLAAEFPGIDPSMIDRLVP